MFNSEDLKPDTRPFLAVYAPAELAFLLKYFDREFDCRITENPTEAAANRPAIALTTAGDSDSPALVAFRNACSGNGQAVITLRLPKFVVGTGMTGEMMRIARGVGRGTMLTIKDNPTSWATIHATDVARAARSIADAGVRDSDFTVAAQPVSVNRLIDAFGQRIKDKRVGSISPRWARLVYGQRLYSLLTTDYRVDTAAFKDAYPDFEFVDPAEYLTTHVYDHDSL